MAADYRLNLDAVPTLAVLTVAPTRVARLGEGSRSVYRWKARLAPNIGHGAETLSLSHAFLDIPQWS